MLAVASSRPAVTTRRSSISALPAQAFRGTVCVTAQTACRPYGRAFSFSSFSAAVACAACREEGDIQISSLDFNGVEQVDKARSPARLQTKRGSRLPWGRKRFFDRRAFEADLKRIEAFYRDRGFPDARVTSFDVQLNDAQDKVDVTVNISEGEPIVVSAIELTGFDVLAGGRRAVVAGDARRCASEQPLDRQLALASRERALNVLRDTAIPTPTSRSPSDESGARSRRRRCSTPCRARWPISARSKSTGRSASARTSSGGSSLQAGRRLHAARDAREPAKAVRSRAVRVRQRRVARGQGGCSRPTSRYGSPLPKASTSKVNIGVGYGTEEQARARLRWDHVNFLGGARHAGLRGEVVVARPRRARRVSRAVLPAAALLAQLRGAGVAGGRAGLLAQLAGRPRHAAPPGQLRRTSGRCRSSTSTSAARVTPEALEDFHDPRRADCAGARSARRRVHRDARRDCVRHQPQHHDQPARRTQRLRPQRARRTGGQVAGGDVGLLVDHRRRRGITCRSGAGSSLANRLRVGHDRRAWRRSRATSRSTSAISSAARRAFAGGGGSRSGPISGFGLPIGGHTMLEGSSEVRVPLTGKFGGVAFVDFGNVWSQPWDFKPATCATPSARASGT